MASGGNSRQQIGGKSLPGLQFLKMWTELNEVCNGSEAILETHFESVGLLGEDGVKGVGIKCLWGWERLYKPEI